MVEPTSLQTALLAVLGLCVAPFVVYALVRCLRRFDSEGGPTDRPDPPRVNHYTGPVPGSGT